MVELAEYRRGVMGDRCPFLELGGAKAQNSCLGGGQSCRSPSWPSWSRYANSQATIALTVEFAPRQYLPGRR